MKIYTASTFTNCDRVRAFNQDLRDVGHEVTHDWTASEGNTFDADLTPEQRRHHAELDRDGVTAADLVVCLFDVGRPTGGLMEFGGAAFSGIECWVLRPKEWTLDVKLSIFYDLPNVTVVDDEDAIRGPLGMVPKDKDAFDAWTGRNMVENDATA